MTKTKGTIIRISRGGVVYVRDPSRQKVAGFSLGKILNYRGETAQELSQKGLRPGGQVVFEYDEQDRVQSAQVVAA